MKSTRMARVLRHAALCGTGAIFALTLAAGAASAADPGDFLKGKTVHFYVGYSPGGGYDFYARMLAPHFEKLTGAEVVVENRPGGTGLTALNQLVRTKPDGLSMMMLNGEGAIMAQLTKLPVVRYDMTKVSILGRVTVEQHVFLVRPGMPDNMKDFVKYAQQHEVKLSATGRPDNLGDYEAVVCEAFKLKCKIITGYKGSKESGLAVMNGEVDALAISDNSGVNYASGGKVKIIATIGKKRSELKPDMPTLYEMFPDLPLDQKRWLDFRLGIKEVGRVIVGTPGIPKEKLEYIQGVWKKILTDPKVIAEGKKAQHTIDYEDPADMQKTIRDLLEALPANERQEVIDVVIKKFS